MKCSKRIVSASMIMTTIGKSNNWKIKQLENQTIGKSNNVTLLVGSQKARTAATRRVLQKSDIEHILHQRLQQPKPCKNSSLSKFKIDPSIENWAPYLLRCEYRSKYQRNYNKPLKGGRATKISKDFIYSHIWKAGGTTIGKGINRLFDDGKLNVQSINKYNGRFSATAIHNFVNDNATIFSFVRDPIEKFKSAFFEVIKRSIVEDGGRKIRYRGINWTNWRNWKNMPPMKLFRKTIKAHSKRDSYVNPHFASNMHFLAPNRDNSKNLKFNVVGNLNNLQKDLGKVLRPFINDETLKNDQDLLMNRYFMHQRDRHNVSYANKSVEKYSLKEDALSDEDIADLCEMYWMDYICLPFDVPIQCDMTKLIVDHYGKDVYYKDCY